MRQHGENGQPANTYRCGNAIGAVFVVLLALTLRFVYYHQAQHCPLFRVPLIDAKEYDGLAQQFVECNLLAPDGRPYWQPPFYPMFLALIYFITGHSLLAARVAQFGMGAASTLIVYLLATRYFNRRVALLAGILCATNATLIYHDGELLTPSLTIFLNLTAIWLLSSIQNARGVERSDVSQPAITSRRGATARRRGTFRFAVFPNILGNRRVSTDFSRLEHGVARTVWRACWRPAVSGLLLGLSAITRPDALAFALAAAIWLYLVSRPSNPSTSSTPPKWVLVLFTAGVALPVLVVTVRNYAVSGQRVLISYNGGINFYIGNSPDAITWQRMRPGTGWNHLASAPMRESGIMEESASSAYFYRRTLSECRAAPLSCARVFGRKMLLFWNAREIRRNADEYFYRAYSPLYRALLWRKGRFGFPFGVLGPLSLLGLSLFWPRRRELALLYLYAATQYAMVVLFFVTSRYRVPVIPVLSIFAAAAVFELVRNLRTRDFGAVSRSALILVPLVAISLMNSPLVSEDQRKVDGETYYYIASAYVLLEDYPAAIRELRRSIALDSTLAGAHEKLGALYWAQGKDRDAARELEIAVKLDPTLETARGVLDSISPGRGR